MKKAWLLLAAAAVALVLCPVIVAIAQDTGGDTGGKGGKGGFGKGAFAPVTLTDDQTATMKPKVDALKTAATALNDAAKTALGDTDGPRYTRQAAMQVARDLNPNMGGKGGKGGGGKGGKKGGGDATPATT